MLRQDMNPLDALSPGEEAIIEYGDGEFQILKPGAYVKCAVTDVRISLEALKYWNVDKQEAYVNAEASMKGFGVRR